MSEIKFQRLSLMILLCIATGYSWAQKNDHIVLNDTVFIEGFVRQDDADRGHSVLFKRKMKDPWIKYRVDEVSEYYVSNTKYLRKTEPESRELVFLELIPIQMQGYQLLKSVERKGDIYLESIDGFQKLGENFREVLRAAANNPELDPLLVITDFKPYDIAYFLTQAGTFQKSKTYTTPISFNLFAGVGMTANQTAIPFTNKISTIKGGANQIGLLIEFALNPSRNISIGSGVNLMKVASQEFLQFKDANTAFEIDAFLDFEVVQVPVQARYYLDFIPNSWRGFFEIGYSVSFIRSGPFHLNVAELKDMEVLTYRNEYIISGSYRGFQGGVGLEKLLRKSKALQAGVRIFDHGSDKGEKFKATTGYINFKF